MRSIPNTPVKFLMIVLVIGLVVFMFLIRGFKQISWDPYKFPNVIEYNIEDVEDIIKDISGVEPAPSTPASVRSALKAILGCRDRPLERESIQYGEYWLVRNLIRGTVSTTMGCAEAITYTTIGDFTFVDNLAMLTQRWRGPISFAIFTPGFDILGAMDAIYYVRNCLPESELIRQYVSFHVYFPARHMATTLPHSEQEAIDWVPSRGKCEMFLEPPYRNVQRSTMYKNVMNLTYPINVGRNIARKAANTYFILSSDIELIPSVGLADMFLQMVEDKPQTVFDFRGERTLRVFPLPVFELDVNSSVPSNKEELLQLLAQGLAIPFHSKICRSCHLVPEQKLWMNSTNNTDRMSVFTVGKRIASHKFWEPFYISDNFEPYFDERVTWEGQSNKRIQNYAMCLLDYEYHVLHPSFLAHAPGKFKLRDNKDPRYKFVPAMNKVIAYTIKPEYKILYGKNSACTP